MNKPPSPKLAQPLSLDALTFLASARLWLVLACVMTLFAHAVFGLSLALGIGLINCALFATLQARSFQRRRADLLLVRSPPPAQPSRGWQSVLPTVLGALAIGLVAWQHKTILGKEAGLACLTVLASFKLWECRQARDVHILAGLLFFLQLGVFLREESFLALSLVLASAVLTLSAWVFFTAHYASSAWLTARSTRQTMLAPLKETLRLAALGLPLALLLFFVFPRIAGPLWGLPQDAISSRMGLSNSLEPGRFAQLAASDELALSVKFEAAVPPAPALYWRGPVLSAFDGLVWRPIELKQRLQAPPDLLNLPQNYRYVLIAEPHKLNLRVLLDLPLAASGGIELSLQASPTGGVLLERETVQAVSTAQLRWGVLRGANTLQTTQQRLDLQNELDLPAGANPRALAYASELRQKLGLSETDPTPFIQALLNQYHNEFSYTLSPPTPQGRKEDAIDGFFFDTKAGYCEHFAASFVVIMRALDFPARIVTGYQGGELNAQDGWMTVRQSDAHAWAEVLHPTQGWLRIDPTAAVAPWRVQAGGADLQNTAGQKAQGLSGIGKATRDALLPLRQWAQATARVWQDYGLNYGKNSQKELFNRLGFPDVDTASVALLLSGAIGVWLLLAAWTHRNRASARSAHALALAQFDAQCRRTLGPQQLTPRAPNQTPRQWLAVQTSALTAAQTRELQAAMNDYELRSFAPVK